MGRYTSIQNFSDQETKIIPNKGTDVSGSATNVDEYKPTKLVTEKVENPMGSCAGAGSGEFDMYRKARRREQMRLEEIEKEDKATRERMDYEARVLKKKLECEERTRKNAEKRKRKKMKKMKNKLDHNNGNDGNRASNSHESNMENDNSENDDDDDDDDDDKRETNVKKMK
jgi:hypothetical protein